jgi:hypothetical protein
MFSYTDISSTMASRGVNITPQEYIFCLNIVMGEDNGISYILAFEPEKIEEKMGDDGWEKYLNDRRHDANLRIRMQNIVKLMDELRDIYNNDVQNKALNLENYKFTGGQIAQILQNLLHNRISDLDSASTKDVISLIKLLTEQFGIEGNDDFTKHFIQVYPHFNAICGKCNKEFDAIKGIDCVCSHCGCIYKWNEEENRFYPNVDSL